MEDDLLNYLTDINFVIRPSAHIERPATDGRLIGWENEHQTKYKALEIDNTSTYAEKFVKKEENLLWERFESGYDPGNASDETNEAFYQKYRKFANGQSSQPKLPIFDQKYEILDKINAYPIVILEGPTGCGKTTQVPQYIFDDAIQQRKRCNIVICQPRRVAAASNAQRVAVERNWPLTTIVGYQVGLDDRANQSDDTRILFCTTGVLLEKLIRSAKDVNPLGKYTHIILDEVHERDKNMDFLFIVLKKLMNPYVKIILMSATINTIDFSEYFSMPINGRFRKAPIISINKKKNNFEVHTYYLDDLEYLCRLKDPHYRRPYVFDAQVPKIHDEVYNWALRLIILFERLDRNDSKYAHVDEKVYENGPKPTVLIFLPGINEINTMYRYLEEWKLLNQETTVLRIIMHSTVSSKQTEFALLPSTGNLRKIILATNVAESSITVPDVKYVIDFCLTKNLINDSKTNFTTLRMDWASQVNCEQRKGRTGRLMDGKCYRLVPMDFYRGEMKRTKLPEMVSSPLENMVLKTKLLDMGSPEEILALAMDKPKLVDIANTILLLKEVGALFRTVNGTYMAMDGDITFIGQVMADMPIDVKLTKMLIFGHCFSVLKECIIMAAALNCTHNIFQPNAKNAISFYTQLLRWANGSGSDLFAMLHVYNVWRQKHSRNEFGYSDTRTKLLEMRKRENAWAERYCLNMQGLYECHAYAQEIRKRLYRKGIKTTGKGGKWKYNERMVILKVVIAGAFYPNYLMRSMKDEREAFKEINGLDPRNTVYFSKFENQHDRCFYVKTIKDFFVRENIVSEDDLVNIKVTFGSSEKAFVTFRNDEKEKEDEYGLATMPGKIAAEVYKSVKARQLRLRLNINVMEIPEVIERMAETRGLIPNMDGSYILPSYIRNKEDIWIPKLLDEAIVGAITHVDHCGRFWLQPTGTKFQLNEFYQELNNEATSIEPFRDSVDIQVGQILAAPFVDNDAVEYYRAKVLKIIHNDSKKPEAYKVLFIDFGNTHICLFPELRRLRGVAAGFIDIPPCCFECCLATVQPAVLDSQNGTWSREANQWFNNATDGKEVTAHVYSVVNGVSSVFITIGAFDVNKRLVEKGYAELCEESFASKENHAFRQFYKQRQENPNTIDPGLLDYMQKDFQKEINPPPEKLCTRQIQLKGPISPLETNIAAMIEGAITSAASIDPGSVNSVLLNNEPQEHTRKFMVAASVSKRNADELVARHTTLMPCIRGFASLMALIFCPTMEIKRDEPSNRYTSIITGLGFDKERPGPYLEEHDMKMDLDVEITEDDIDKINEIRFSMDSLLFTEPGQMLANVFSESTKNKLAEKIKDLIVGLLEKPRSSVEYVGNIHWNEYPTADILEPKLEDVYGARAIFPMHRTLKLQPMKIERKLELQANCALLHSLKNLYSSGTTNADRGNHCKLCDCTMATPTDIWYHLISRLHTDREAEIGFKYNATN